MLNQSACRVNNDLQRLSGVLEVIPCHHTAAYAAKDLAIMHELLQLALCMTTASTSVISSVCS